MAKAKNKNAGASATILVALAELTRDQLLELAAEKEIAVDPDLEIDVIVQALVEANPSLADGVEIEKPSDEGDAGGGDPPDDKPDGSEAAAQTGDILPGTIRVIKGVECVSIGGAWIPAIREKIDERKPVAILSKNRAGKTIVAATGKPITFDHEGKAVVSAIDAQYLESIVIDDVPEFTVE